MTTRGTMSLGQQQAWSLSNAAVRGCTCCAGRAEQIAAAHSSMRQNGAAPSQTRPRRLCPCRLGLCPRGLGCTLSDLGCALVAWAVPLLGCVLTDLGGLCPCGLGYALADLGKLRPCGLCCTLAVWGCALVAWAAPEPMQNAAVRWAAAAVTAETKARLT